MIIIALLLGLFIGCSISLYFISEKLIKSNEYGNYKGTLKTFAELDFITYDDSVLPYSLSRKHSRHS